jgi:hypothetical protein
MNRFCKAAALTLVVPKVWARPIGVMPYSTVKEYENHRLIERRNFDLFIKL